MHPSFHSYKSQQARLSRNRLYPLTAFYGAYTLTVLVLVALSARPWLGLAVFLAGAPVWTLVEYLFHRFVLHGRFPERTNPLGRWMHDRLDPLHWEHHERPFDGRHISGQLSDLIWLFVFAGSVSALLPVYTASALLAGTVLGYVVEEWVHHSVHFYAFRNRYFRYLQRYHRYHHSTSGTEQGYGLTSGFWDRVFGTAYPAPIESALKVQKEGDKA